MPKNGSLKKPSPEPEVHAFEDDEDAVMNGFADPERERLSSHDGGGSHEEEEEEEDGDHPVGAEEREDTALTDLDAERLFAISLGTTKLLTRDEESALAQDIVRARARVRRVIRQARRLSRAALADAGRGVVMPETDFREREAITILNHAREKLLDRRPHRAVGMTRRELQKFVRELSAALTDYRRLRDQMAEANIRLVSMLSRQYRHPTITFLDLVQEGTLGLFRAIEKYEPTRKVKFSTYAVWWIWQAIARAVDNHGALIRTPVHWSQFRRRVNRESQVLASDDVGSLEELPSTRGIDPQRVAMMAQTFRYVSTDAPATDQDDRPLETVVADEELEPEEQIFQTDLRQRLDDAIAQLPAREAYILRERFGLRNDQSQTLEEIGSRFGVSRERIRQLENRALKQLREVCSAQGLQAYLQ